jgi:prepilin-type N-terminal cleavage/methylation domain-containing protein
MIFRKLLVRVKKQAGFTLVELIVALAITGIIGVGAAMANAQVLTQTARNNDYTTGGRQTLNAIHWIGRDTQMAQDIQTSGNSGFPLTLSWTEWDNKLYQIIYSLENGKLKRSYSVDGGEPVEALVAEYISLNDEMTYCSSDNGVLYLQITACVGQEPNSTNVTRVRKITSRPNL